MAHSNLARVSPTTAADPLDDLLDQYIAAVDAYERFSIEDTRVWLRQNEEEKQAFGDDGHLPCVSFVYRDFKYGEGLAPVTISGHHPKALAQCAAKYVRLVCSRHGPHSVEAKAFRARLKEKMREAAANLARRQEIYDRWGRDALDKKSEAACLLMHRLEEEIGAAGGDTLTAAYAKLVVSFRSTVHGSLSRVDHDDGESFHHVLDGDAYIDEVRAVADAINIIAKMIGRPGVNCPQEEGQVPAGVYLTFAE